MEAACAAAETGRPETRQLLGWRVRVGCSAFVGVSVLCFINCLSINLFLASLEQVRTALRHTAPYFKRIRPTGFIGGKGQCDKKNTSK